LFPHTQKLLDEVGEAALSADMDLDVVEVVRDAIAGGHSFSAAAAKAKAAAAASRAESQNLDGLVRSKSGEQKLSVIEHMECATGSCLEV
jgi:hypothetical protein